ncbi:MAG: superinfection immunity protein [Myxococcota bacterium]|nr:superinfection immunity protein [Myxococcota bacterium]
MEAIVVLVFLALGLLLYLVPWLAARDRRHPKETAILVLNLLLGWTLLGWVAALIWAFTDAGPSANEMCAACRMRIDPAATICPHCRTPRMLVEPAPKSPSDRERQGGGA